MNITTNEDLILQINHLSVNYYTNKQATQAVKDVSFNIRKGEIVGIVGESGSGKSTIAKSIIKLINPNYTRITQGEVLYKNNNLLKLTNNELRKVRGKKIAMIFQNASTALDPVYTIGNQIMEMLLLHENISKQEAYARALDLLKEVNLSHPEKRMNQFPHELSGGMQQRVMIAIAMSCNPDILIADEPTTALDVTTQARILKLLLRLRDEHGISIIFITHDMGVVAQICDRVVVMYKGALVEEGDTMALFSQPKHPYTKGLLAAIPSIVSNQEWLYTVDDFMKDQ